MSETIWNRNGELTCDVCGKHELGLGWPTPHLCMECGRKAPRKRTAEEILRSIVADVEAMECSNKLEESHSLGLPESFGPFEAWTDLGDGTACVHWPNLAILIDEAKQILK